MVRKEHREEQESWKPDHIDLTSINYLTVTWQNDPYKAGIQI